MAMLTTVSELLPGIHPTPRNRRIWLPWIIGMIALVGLIAWFTWIALSSSDKTDPNNANEATYQCETEIQGRLKSPTTAEFNSTATGGGPWTVTGTVDAENSFGAKIRSSYQCTVTIDAEGARVRVDSLK